MIWKGHTKPTERCSTVPFFVNTYLLDNCSLSINLYLGFLVYILYFTMKMLKKINNST